MSATTHEEWRPVAGFDGYEISNLGRVRSYRCQAQRHIRHRSPHLIKARPIWSGYLQFGLRDGYKRHWVSAHRLVAIAFHGNPPTSQHQVNHKDGDRSNNHANNLEWVTAAENSGDKRRRALLSGDNHWTHRSPDLIPRGERWHAARRSA